MLKLLVSFTVFIIFVFSGVSAAAQSGPTTPLGDGDEGWCTYNFDENGISTQCGFGAPGAACNHQITTHYPQGSLIYTGTLRRSDANYACLTQRNSEFTGSELFIGVTGVTKQCHSGAELIGGVCTEIPLTYCDTVCAGKQIASEAGNPIDIVTGAKVQSFTDFSSADDRFVIKRYYNSLPFGENGHVYGLTSTGANLGDKWMLSTAPVMVLGSTFAASGTIIMLGPDGFGRESRASSTTGIYTPRRNYAGGGGLEYEIALEDGLPLRSGSVSRTLRKKKSQRKARGQHSQLRQILGQLLAVYSTFSIYQL